MADYTTLKTAIAAVIKQNGNNEITGDILQNSMLSLITALGTNKQYAGVATPGTVPGTVDANIFYLAVTRGTYANFGGYVHDGRTVRIFSNTTSGWSVTNTGILASQNTFVLSKDEYGLAAFIEDIVIERMPNFVNADIYKPDGNLRKFSIQNIDPGEVANNIVIYRENDEGVLGSYINNTVQGSFNEFNPNWVTDGGNIMIGNGKLRFRIKMKRIPTTRLYPMFDVTQINEAVLKRMLVNYELSKITDDIAFLKSEVSTEPFELLPENSRLNADTPLNGANAGDWWQLRFPGVATNNIEKSVDFFNVTLDYDGGAAANPAFWAINKVPASYVGQSIKIKFDVKSNGSTNSVKLIAGGTSVNNAAIVEITNDWVSHEYDLVLGSLYPDRRIMFYVETTGGGTGTTANFSIRNISIAVLTGLAEKIDDIDQRVGALENSEQSVIGGVVNNFNIPNTLSNIMKILFDNSNSVIQMGFFGDSWTQGVGTVSDGLIGYLKYFTRIIQEKYGYAGLGWFDFGYSNSTDMKCADDEAVILTKTGSFTHVTKTANALGVSIAHTVFPISGSYKLDFPNEDKKVDRAIIRFYNNAQFNVIVNGGSPTLVTATPAGGWQEYEVTGDITSLEVVATAENTIIFGVMLYYGNKGVIVNKFGNRGMNTVQPLAVDIANWKTGLSKFDLNFFAVLLATNDRTQSRPPQTVADNISQIISNAKDVFPNSDHCIIMPSNNKRTELYTIKQYTDECYNVALANNLPFVPLLPIFGTTEQINALGTFNDDVHPTKMGSYMIGEFIFKNLFEFKQY